VKKHNNVLRRIITVILMLVMITGGVNIGEKEADATEADVKAVWFSYIEIRDLLKDKSEADFTTAFTQVCDNLVNNNCNTIYAHVRANEDAMYPSQYFPWSTSISSSGNALSYDPLSIMISVAHSKGIKFYAWVNPYRISVSTDKTNKLLTGAYDSTTYQNTFNDWYSKGMVTRQTYNSNDCLFLNPNNDDAKNLIVNGINEIVTNYSVDGVIFDDYFYVWWNSSDEADPASAISARMSRINGLVSSVYATIKAVNSGIQFGISPEGNIDNAKRQGCDVDTWLSSSGYVDFIAPQLYWTDSYGADGATTMYSNRLSSWLALVKNSTPVYPALALYRAGSQSTTDLGWSQSSANLLNQWNVASSKGCKGYSLFSYSYMLTDAGKAELNNLNGTNINYTDGTASVLYQTHVQGIGWQGLVNDGAMSGTSGQSKRLESINIKVNSSYSGSVTYRTHVQSYGWQAWVSDGANSGTTGQSKRLEAIEIKLTGELEQKYDIYYRVHAQTYGWLGWAKNGETAGTTGKSKRLEAIQIVLVQKGGAAPGDTSNHCVETLVKYATHVQTYGWQAEVSDGALSGTSGQSKRLEAITIQLANQKYSGGISYRVHCQTYGWLDWVSDGAMAGTSGQSKRLEAIEIKLTGEMAEHYDVYYRVHCQTYGWLDWVKNGETAGTSGESKRLEAIQIQLVPKN
jgi:uncharacterized lipoprotein YddW (UPF0748 family)/uncharacterized protein YjdB